MCSLQQSWRAFTIRRFQQVLVVVFVLRAFTIRRFMQVLAVVFMTCTLHCLWRVFTIRFFLQVLAAVFVAMFMACVYNQVLSAGARCGAGGVSEQ